MPDLEDTGSKEIIEEEPLVDVPPMEGPPAIPWVHFEAQICQDELPCLHGFDTCTSAGRRAGGRRMMPDVLIRQIDPVNLTEDTMEQRRPDMIQGTVMKCICLSRINDFLG